MSTELAVGLALPILIGMSVRVVPERERLAVLRLGRFIGTRGPGIIWTIPFVEKAIRFDLDRGRSRLAVAIVRATGP